MIYELFKKKHNKIKGNMPKKLTILVNLIMLRYQTSSKNMIRKKLNLLN